MRLLRSIGLLTFGLLMLILVLAPPLHAQWRAAPRFEALDRQLQIGPAAFQGMPLNPTLGSETTGESNASFATTFVFASAGSLIGFAAGAGLGIAYYEATGCCGGGDDPGLNSVLSGMVIGSTTGSTLGAALFGGESWGGSFLGSTIGVATGALIAYAGGQIGASGGAIFLYSLAQGLTTATATALLR